MKRTGNLYWRIAEPRNLRLAFWKAQRGKSGKSDVIAFRRRLDSNLEALREQLLDHELSLGEYHYFTVYDPKKRRICAASFRERVLHHAIMNVCDEAFERYQIFDSYASRRGKGTHAALTRASEFTHRFRWFLKLDVRRYFDSIDHGVLEELLRRLFKDRDLLVLFDRIIRTYENAPARGLPIGNLTSQYFANHVLGVADHCCKEQLRLKGYVRYMDDMVLWHDDRAALLAAGRRLCDLIENRLRLTLKLFCLNRCSRGIPFLGYIVKPHTILLSARSRRRYVRQLRQAYGRLLQGKWDQREFAAHVQPLIAFTRHADARGFRRKIMQDFGCCSRARTV